MTSDPLDFLRAYRRAWVKMWRRALQDPRALGCLPPSRVERPAMTAPVERASDWDGERPSAEVIEFRRNGGF